MYRPEDPRFRRTLNTITTNLTSANESAQYSLFSLSETYIKPCFGGLRASLQPCTESLKPCLTSTATCLETCLDPCFGQCLPARSSDAAGGGRTPRRGFLGVGGPRVTGRGSRRDGGTFSSGRGRGIEHSFDFYDDWAEDLDENDALLALEDGEFDRVVGSGGGANERGHGYPHSGTSASAGTEARQPAKRRMFDYGAAAKASSTSRARRRTKDGYEDGEEELGTVIPQQSYFGFLSRLPFGIRRPGLRYQPSAADLQVRPQQGSARGGGRSGRGGGSFGLGLQEEEGEGLLEEEGYDDDPSIGYQDGQRTSADAGKHRRARSNTQTSGHTTDSLSSRGDLFPSDEEDDAREIDDTFETELSRQRSGGEASGDASSGRGSSKGSGAKKAGARRKSLKSGKSNTSQKSKNSKSSTSSGTPKSESDHEQGGPEMAEPLRLPTMEDLRREEEAAREKEEVEVEMKREAAQRLARERGLSVAAGEEDGAGGRQGLGQQGSRRSSGSGGNEPFDEFEGRVGEEMGSGEDSKKEES